LLEDAWKGAFLLNLNVQTEGETGVEFGKRELQVTRGKASLVFPLSFMSLLHWSV
jgi:hypothetical protein